MNRTSRKGLRYEDRARLYLQQRGLRLIKQNFCSRFGEIDLLMLERGVICFIEVKFRASLSCGGAAYSIPLSKRRKIVKTALFYLARHKQHANRDMRFDAFLIQRQPDGRDRIEWIRNAFYAE